MHLWWVLKQISDMASFSWISTVTCLVGLEPTDTQTHIISKVPKWTLTENFPVVGKSSSRIAPSHFFLSVDIFDRQVKRCCRDIAVLLNLVASCQLNGECVSRSVRHHLRCPPSWFLTVTLWYMIIWTQEQMIYWCIDWETEGPDPNAICSEQLLGLAAGMKA